MSLASAPPAAARKRTPAAAEKESRPYRNPLEACVRGRHSTRMLASPASGGTKGFAVVMALARRRESFVYGSESVARCPRQKAQSPRFGRTLRVGAWQEQCQARSRAGLLPAPGSQDALAGTRKTARAERIYRACLASRSSRRSARKMSTCAVVSARLHRRTAPERQARAFGSTRRAAAHASKRRASARAQYQRSTALLGQRQVTAISVRANASRSSLKATATASR